MPKNIKNLKNKVAYKWFAITSIHRMRQELYLKFINNTRRQEFTNLIKTFAFKQMTIEVKEIIKIDYHGFTSRLRIKFISIDTCKFIYDYLIMKTNEIDINKVDLPL